VGGLVGAFLGRRDRAMPVTMADVSDRAARKMADVDRQPVKVVSILEQNGVEIERIEKELFARQDRDETVRFGASANPLRR
jgi:hypothetical protein